MSLPTDEQLEILLTTARTYGVSLLAQFIAEEQGENTSGLQTVNLLLIDDLRRQVRTFLEMK